MMNKAQIIELTGFQPAPESLALLQALEAAGFDKPLLQGGAVRDDYLRQKTPWNILTRDYDLTSGIDVAKVLGGAKTDAEAEARLMASIQQAFPGSVIAEKKYKGGYVEPDLRVHMRANGSLESGGVTFFDQGKEVELRFNNDKAARSIEDRMWADAPISMIAVDATGRVFADKDFEAHARGRIFKPYELGDPAYGYPYYAKLARKIPGLRLDVPPDYAPKTDDALEGWQQKWPGPLQKGLAMVQDVAHPAKG